MGRVSVGYYRWSRMQLQDCEQVLLGEIISALSWTSSIWLPIEFWIKFKMMVISFKVLIPGRPPLLTCYPPKKKIILQFTAYLWCLAAGMFSQQPPVWGFSIKWPCPGGISCHMIHRNCGTYLSSTESKNTALLFSFSWVGSVFMGCLLVLSALCF